jgi:ribosomal protein S18 acetylase RimI-like enzyme
VAAGSGGAGIAPQTTLRREPLAGDVQRVKAIAHATGFFSPAEVAVAAELVEERLAQGSGSGYEFVFAEAAGEVLAYTCFGPIPMTTASWDLYWIAVRPEAQGRGLGRAVLAESEQRARQAGGTRIYVDTSSRPKYEPTRSFYRACGYREVALLEDFYAPADGKVIFCKVLSWSPPASR